MTEPNFIGPSWYEPKSLPTETYVVVLQLRTAHAAAMLLFICFKLSVNTNELGDITPLILLLCRLPKITLILTLLYNK